ncbi:MAG: class I SAM-dependent methyltransferase [Acidobacteria bacterium]|nr:class I SAM-dependent methyltransferase [Acidobacteriota bacterium]
MQKPTDWLVLWRELSGIQESVFKTPGEKDSDDMWRKRAAHFDSEIKRRWAKPDSSRNFVTSQLRSNPEWTVLDIGGGTGAWACLMAQHCRHVTVVEPSPAMIGIMRRNLAESDIRNVETIEAEWPDIRVDKHDLVLCSHAMYGFADFEAFIGSIETVSRHLCILIIRAPDPKDLMSIAAMHIWGQPYDSPDYQVAFNALIQLGIFPNVLMDDTGLWDPWASPNMEEALTEAKRRLRLPEKSEHDDYLRDLLQHNLTPRDGKLFWPRGIRSALVYWDVNRE